MTSKFLKIRAAGCVKCFGQERGGSAKCMMSSTRSKKSCNIMDRLVKIAYDIIEDFSADSPIESKEEKEKDVEVNTSKLKANVKRFDTALQPYIKTVKGMQGLFRWKSSAYTLIVFMVYMHAVWKGYLLQVFLFCLIFRHFISYLQSKYFFSRKENESEKEDTCLGNMNKTNVLVSMGQRMQVFLGQAADCLEKIESVLTWKSPKGAKRVFTALCIGFVLSMVVDYNFFFIVFEFYLGLQLFIMNYVDHNYPRVKRKYNILFKLWKSLPTREEWTNANLEGDNVSTVYPDLNLSLQKENTGFGPKNTENSAELEVADRDREFIELFCLPPSEIPLSGWRGGRRCTLVNREKKGIGVFKNGKLYLTKRYMV
ncbi:GRAM domain-containing protein 4-like [Crassostrea angulata]|uniref:GRAM domain-containing protein 4-like n=1 Tax=Magallana angulata TaxID=2784310 RepID=UPI0022B19953|nr:GRAM domain-containing protein 4-like [Crassostrea angulata]